MVRTIQTINVTFSQMADSKASILMGATFLVFSIVVGQAKNGPLPPELIVLALSAFLSALCAVFAVLPKISNPRRHAPGQSEPNKLFFGYFAHVPEPEWTDDILGSLRSDEALFRLMLHDIYQNGQVLERKKYRFLGYAYRIFTAGLCLTLLILAIDHLPILLRLH